MNFSTKKMFILILVIIGLYMLTRKENIENTTIQTCRNNATEITKMTQVNKESGQLEEVDISNLNAQELCQRISTRAEEIVAEAEKAKATGDAVWGPFDNVTAWLDPKNYQGNSQSSQMMRNILNTNLSSSDMAEINNSCANINLSFQLNEIDNTKCEYCQKYGCTTSGIIQENSSVNQNLCAIASTIDKLRNKKSSIDANALIKVLQERQGVLSGNQSSNVENCNVINVDMSSTDYLTVKNCCSNNTELTQINTIKNCGNAYNNIQKNLNKLENQCLIDQDVIQKETIDSTQKITTELQNLQKSLGISSTASLGSSVVCSIVCSVLLSGLMLLNNPQTIIKPVV